MNAYDYATHTLFIGDPPPLPKPATPLSDAALEQFPRFTEAVRVKLEAGRREYGDESFRRAPEELLGELAAEALDMAGWGFVLWCRIQAVLGRMGEARPVSSAGEGL